MAHRMRVLHLLPGILAGILSLSSPALAEDDVAFKLTMHNQQFVPDKLIVSAGIKVKIILSNLDSVPQEFESYDLALEVFVPEHGKKAIYVGPLNPGSYRIFNGFYLPMQGWIVAKPVVKNGELSCNDCM